MEKFESDSNAVISKYLFIEFKYIVQCQSF